MSARSEFFAGARAEIPLLVGVVPFGLIYGALAVQLGVPAAPALGMSAIIFAGSAQFVALPLLAAAVPAAVTILTVFVINLRHALYSANIAPYLASLPLRWKALLAYLMTDEAYVVVSTHFQAGADARFRHWYFLGAGAALWVSWLTSTAVGIFVGAQIPASWQLDFFLPLTFIAIVTPLLTTRANRAVALVAGVAAVATFLLPYKAGLLVAAFLGLLAGMLVTARGSAARNDGLSERAENRS